MLRKRNIWCLGMAAWATACAPEPAREPANRGKIEVQRVWQEAATGTARALVEYRNTSGETYDEAVTVQCVARDAAGRAVGQGQRSLFAAERGPIAPGQTATLEIPARLNGAAFATMSCEIISAG